MAKNKKISVKGTEITILSRNNDEYISLTDLAKYKDTGHTDDIIKNWLRNRNTIELLGFWEQLNNSNFKPVEFDGFRKKAGLNSFVLTPKKWIETTNAIGIVSKPGRYGGTFAHKDIAFEFASWISIEFKLYIIKEFQRLKEKESSRLKLKLNFQFVPEQKGQKQAKSSAFIGGKSKINSFFHYNPPPELSICSFNNFV